MPDLPSVRCDWRMPVDDAERPLATAADIVAVFPYPNEKNTLDGFTAPLAARAKDAKAEKVVHKLHLILKNEW